jgi:hypothetical protein
MFGSGLSFESLLSGSITRFRERSHPDQDAEAFRELQRKKEGAIGEGIDRLRRIRTAVFESTDPDAQQRFLQMAVRLADQMADYCLADSLDRGAPLTDHSYHRELEGLGDTFTALEPQSKHHIVPRQVAHHLRKAAQDLLIRTEEKTASLMSPSKPLSQAEMREVVKEFTSGTNCLTINAQEILFSPDTRIAGIISGGLVYALMVKKISERYGDNQASSLAVLAVAVDGEGKQAVFEKSGDVHRVKHLVVVDDLIDKGGSVVCAAHNAEDIFTGAAIYSGVNPTSYPAGRIPPSQRRHMGHLEGLFQDFADLTESGKLSEAWAILMAAAEYAQANGVKLQPGWRKRAARYFTGPAGLMGRGAA